ncbi:transcription factor sox- hypothetical protein [Limosa lapponica baueri]|uniref:Uncharacterized protein n=1 Tax=Limosa lapponica baueri TaxID=1758121 RepID=A0A2I0U9Z0_LIMLA|nr:transcription factor sox- hypothetical protein [Limosa lapponica baueri]
MKKEREHEQGGGESLTEVKVPEKSGNGKEPWRGAAVKAEPLDEAFEACRVKVEKEDAPAGSLCGPAHASPADHKAQQSEGLGVLPEDLKIPVVFHPLPPGTRIQIQGPLPSELIHVTKVPVKQVPLKMQSLLEPSVKIETKNVPLTVLPSDSGITLRVHEPPKEYPGVPIFPRGVPLPQATPCLHSRLYESPPIGQPASLFGVPPRIPFCHPYFVPGPHYFPSRYQRQEMMFSALDGNYPFKEYPEESIREDRRSCESLEVVSCYSSCKEERYLSPLPQLDIGALEEVLSAPSTPSSVHLINVTDSDEDDEVKLLREL